MLLCTLTVQLSLQAVSLMHVAPIVGWNPIFAKNGRSGASPIPGFVLNCYVIVMNTGICYVIVMIDAV